MSYSLVEYITSQFSDINSYLAPSQTFALNLDDLSEAQQAQLQQIEGATLSEGSMFFKDKIYIPLTKDTFQAAINIVEGNDNTAYLYCAIAAAVLLAATAYKYYRNKFPKQPDVDSAARSVMEAIDVSEEIQKLYQQMEELRNQKQTDDKIMKVLVDQYKDLFEKALQTLPYDFGAVVLQKMNNTNYKKISLTDAERDFFTKMEKDEATRKDFYDTSFTAESIFTCLINTPFCDTFYELADCQLMKRVHSRFETMFLGIFNFYSKEIHPTTVLKHLRQISDRRGSLTRIYQTNTCSSPISFPAVCLNEKECRQLVLSLLSFAKHCDCNTVVDDSQKERCKGYAQLVTQDPLEALNEIHQKMRLPLIRLRNVFNQFINYHTAFAHSIKETIRFVSEEKNKIQSDRRSKKKSKLPSIQTFIEELKKFNTTEIKDIQPILYIFKQNNINPEINKAMTAVVQFWEASLNPMKRVLNLFHTHKTLFEELFDPPTTSQQGVVACTEHTKRKCIEEIRSKMGFGTMRAFMILEDAQKMTGKYEELQTLNKQIRTHITTLEYATNTLNEE